MGDLEFDPSYRPPTYWLYGDQLQQLRAVGHRLDRRTQEDVLEQVVAERQGNDPDSDDPHLDLELATMLLGDRTGPAAIGQAVEIANVFMFNPGGDSISVFAEWRDGWIHYSVSDQYGDFWRYRCSPHRSRRPLTFAELVGLIDTAECVEEEGVLYTGLVTGLMDFNLENGGDVDDLRCFIRVTSAFYVDIEAWYVGTCDAWYEHHTYEDEEP